MKYWDNFDCGIKHLFRLPPVKTLSSSLWTEVVLVLHLQHDWDKDGRPQWVSEGGAKAWLEVL